MATKNFLRTILGFNTHKTHTNSSDIFSIPPPPSELLKASSSEISNHSRTHNSHKKTFFPLFSLVLSSFLLPFSADVAQAVEGHALSLDILAQDHGNLNRVELYHSGDAKCLLNSTGPCARVSMNVNGLFKIIKETGKSDVYDLTQWVINKYRNPSTTATFYVSNAILKSTQQTFKATSDILAYHGSYSVPAGTTSVLNGQGFDMYFKNAAYKGNFFFAQGGYTRPTYYTFDGNYNGNSDSSLKGKAFVGDMEIDGNAPVLTFKNGAVGVINNFRDSAYFNTSNYSYGLNLDTGANVSVSQFYMTVSAKGLITVKNHSTLKTNNFGYAAGSLDVYVSNQSTFDMGFVVGSTGGNSAWFDAGIYGWESSPLPAKTQRIINVDNSTLKGTFALARGPRREGANDALNYTGFTFNFTNNAKFEGKITNAVATNTGAVAINLSNTSLPNLDYNQTGNVAPTFNASNNSVLGFKNDFKAPATFAINSSELKDIKTSNGKLDVTGYKAQIGNITATSNGTVTGNFEGSSIGNISTPGKYADSIKINNNTHQKNLNIGKIDFGTSSNSSAKIEINLSDNAKIGDINAKNAQIQAKFDATSVGNITNSNKDSSATFTNTAGQSIGKIGSSTDKFAGNISGTFDFTPVTSTDSSGKTTTKSLSLGDIASSATSKNDMSFVFGGKDSSGNTLGKPTSTINISGGSKDSSYTFANLGNLSTDSSKHKNLSDVSGVKFSSDAGIGSFNLIGTSVELKSGEKLDKNTVNALLGTTTSASDIKEANFVFGNAKLVSKADGSTEIVENKDDKGNTIYSTLTQAGMKHTTGDGYVPGKSSDANIGNSSDSDFKINAEFSYTPGTFDANKGESAWTGKLTGKPENANFSFANAGTIESTQLGSASISDLKVDLKGTTLTGLLGGEVTNSDGTKKPQDVSINIDGTNSAVNKGLSIIGNGKHDITLDFSGNNNKDKFTGAILGGSSDSSLNIKNLDGIKIDSVSGGSIVDGLKNAGITGINNPNAAKDAHGKPMTLTSDQKKDISTSTEFKLTGSSITGNIKDTNYSYNLGFNSTPSKDDKGNTIPAASYNGTSIDFSSNTNSQNLTFDGKGSINPNTHQALNVTLGKGDTSLTLKDTGSTVVLHNTKNVGTDSLLSTEGTSVIGDWTNGTTQAVFDSNSKFYGTIGGGESKPVKVTLGENSLYSSTDSVVQAAYDGALKGTNTDGSSKFATPLIDLSTKGEKDLTFNNPGESLEIKGLSADNGLDKGNLIANNMSLKGDLYSKLDENKKSNVKANLSFSTNTDGKKPTSFSTDHIGVLADGSSISFTGEGSLKPLSPYDESTKKGGITTISLGGYNTGNTNFNLDNTGANVIFSQVEGQKDVKGNFDIRGTNIILDNGLSSWEGSKVNLVFANASKATQDKLLKTKDGTLLTSKTNSSGANKPDSDYVDSSTLTLKAGTVSLKGAYNVMTFIGDSSIMATPSVVKPMELSGNGKAQINLINMGLALASPLKNIIEAQGGKLENIAQALATAQITAKGITNTSAISQAKTQITEMLNKSTMADLLMQNNNAGGAGQVSYTYNLLGTTLGNANIQAPKSMDGKNQTKVTFNAIFDNRELKDRDNDDQKYYQNKDAIGNSLLEIAKSALNGNLSLDANVSAHFSFYGANAQNSSSKISGGANDSTFYYQDSTMNFGASSSFSNLAMNGKVILNGVSATGSYNPTGNVKVVSLGADKKEISGLVFKNYTSSQSPSSLSNNLQSTGYLWGVNANLQDVLALKNTSFIGSIDSTKTTAFVFAGKNSSGFGELDNSKATKLGSGAKNVYLDLIDVGQVQASNINAATSSDGSLSKNEVTLYGQSSLKTTTKDGKETLSIGGGDSIKLIATIDQSNAKLWGANDKGEISFNIEGKSAVNSVYNLTFNGGIPYPTINQSFYTGDIGLLNSSSVINFIDAGNLKDTQFENTKAVVNIIRTTITGDIYFSSGVLDFKNNNNAFQGNVIYKDPNDSVKNLYFDFTNNNNVDKIVNNKASDHSFYLAGGSNSKFTFVNLVDNHFTSSPSPVIWQASNTADGVFNTLGFNGVHFRAAKDDKKPIAGSEVVQNLDDKTTFGFYGTSISGDIASKYSLELLFYNYNDAKGYITAQSDNKTQILLNQSYYSGSSISSDQNLTLNAQGAGALGNTNVNVSSKGVLNIYASSHNGEIGSISTNNVTSGSSITADHLGFSGDFLTSKDTQGKGGSINVSFSDKEVKDGFILGSKDGDVNISLSNITLEDKKEQKIIIGSSKTSLNFQNAGSVHIISSKDSTATDNFDSNFKGNVFADKSSIIARGTSIIGDIYTNISDTAIADSKFKPTWKGTYLNLLFSSSASESTPASFYAGSHIGFGSNITGKNSDYSRLIFDGRGSLKSISKDKSGNETYTDVKNASFAVNLKASDVNLTIVTHNANSAGIASVVPLIDFNNTGGVIALDIKAGANLDSRLDLMNFYSLSLRGVSLYGDSFKGGLYSYTENSQLSGEQKFQMTFSNGEGLDTIIADSSNKGADFKLNNSSLGKDYIESSSYGIKSFQSTQWGGYLAPKFTFIGSGSHNFYDNTKHSEWNVATSFFTNYVNYPNRAPNSTQVNFINADTAANMLSLAAFNTGMTIKGTGSDANALSDKVSGENLGVINLIGTYLSATDLSKTSFTFNAIFDQRGSDKNYVSDESYKSANNTKGFLTTDAFGTLSSSILKVKKSSMSGTLNLGSKVSAHLTFLGNGAFQAADVTDSKTTVKTAMAKIIGGTSSSSIAISDVQNLSYKSLQNFAGTSTIVNSSFNGDLKDISSTAAADSTSTATPSITTGVLKAYFNGANTSLTSDQGKAFIDAYNTSAQDGMKLDLLKDHSFSANIGTTTSSLDLIFIGKSSTGSSFKIQEDNAKNIYSFVDYGKIDLKELSNDPSKVKGTIKWIGDSYQVGKVENSVNANVDLSVTGDNIKDNTYVANGGKQDINFDFGGSSTKPDGSSKEIGVIQDAKDTTDDKGNTIKGGATAESTYTVSNLTDNQSKTPSLSTDGKDIINTLNNTINTTGDNSKNPFQNTTGTIGIEGTTIHGDLSQDTTFKGTDGKDTTFNGTIQATFDTTGENKNPASLDGNIKGNAKKDITFVGENSNAFKDGKTITGGGKDSQYSFQDVGSLDSGTLNNILNGGIFNGVPEVGTQTTAGSFNFDGSTVIAGNLSDAPNHSNAKDQTINIGKDTSKSPDGVIFQGDISTSSTVNASFGVGSNVNINNQNEKSVYDFSNYSGKDAPVVANIYLDGDNKKARVTGFNGDVSLTGSIQDINNAGNQYIFSGGNGKTAGHWILTSDSSVNSLSVKNNNINTDALYAPTQGNPLAIIDLRGNASSASSSNVASAALAGAIIRAASTSANANDYNPLNLNVFLLSADKAVFRMGVNLSNGDVSKLDIGAVSTSSPINYLQFYPEGGGKLTAPLLVANVGASISTNFFKGAPSKVGLRIYTPEVIGKNITDKGAGTGGVSGNTPDVKRTEFFLNSLTSSVNAAVVTPLEQSLSSAYRNFRVETNNLHLRMGELRGIGATQGAWARIMNGMGSDESNTDYYTTIQAGYDYKFDVLGGVNYLGVVADTSIISSKGSDYKGTGNTLGLGIYNTYLMDNGLYIDAISKYLYMHNRINSTASSEQDLNNSAFLLGAELGYRFKLDKAFPAIARNPYTKGYYIEPQLEIIYGYITGNNFNTSLNSVSEASTISATLEGNNALISRIGAVFGKEIRTNSFYGDIRLGISYVNELNTGGSTSLVDSVNPEAISKTTPSNNKLNLSLGTNVKINEDWRVYADISRTFFGIYNIDYNLNIGGRWNFGKKSSALEKNLKAQRQAQQKAALELEKQRKAQEAQKQIPVQESIKVAKILSISEAKTSSQGLAPESGYYLRIVTISSKNANLEKQLKGHSYRIYSFKDSKKKVLYTYLAGPYKTQSEINKDKAAIDKITQWANSNKNIQAQVYEVKNNKR